MFFTINWILKVIIKEVTELRSDICGKNSQNQKR